MFYKASSFNLLTFFFYILRLGDLPADCSLAYYESRRRWIFGGSGLTTRGLAVEGVNNDGGNSHYYSANHTFGDESLLAVAGLGATMFNETPIGRMGEFRERLLWSRAPVVGYGTNDSLGSASTTTADGSTSWSVDNDALPMSFFDPKTGEFVDTIQSRMRSRLMINFGNPFKDKRGDSLIPESYLHQRPPLQQGAFDDDAGRRTPPSSPPNGESIFPFVSHWIQYL
jgi:integrator complex subunit 6